ncbi:MAG: hypothetical protein MJZ22_02950 [Candidatus Saccharibacteria bacterium]|nr:hypothetical protein [Candidatus Saccharibacteria bacterium]
MAFVLAVIIGLALGIGAALFVMATILDKSNNFGDCTADINSFARNGIREKVVDDRATSSTPLDPVQNPYIINLDKKKANAKAKAVAEDDMDVWTMPRPE